MNRYSRWLLIGFVIIALIRSRYDQAAFTVAVMIYCDMPQDRR